MAPRCVLIGPPGAGKSTVGKALAQRLALEFRDTDIDVAERAGKSIPEIFLEDGEPVFRQIEAVVVANALKDHDGVLALGGGAVMSAETAQRVRDSGATVVFLDVSITHAAPRIGFNRDRPLLLVNPRNQWVQLMNLRRSTYESLATRIVNTDGKTPDQVADEIVEAVSQ